MADSGERYLRAAFLARVVTTVCPPLGALFLGVLALAPRVAWAASDVETTQTQLQSICDALKKSSGQTCGARAPRPDPTPMSSEVSAAPQLNQPPERALVRPVDAWGRAVRISVDGGTVNLVSSGPDGEFGTADDIAQRCPR